MTNLHIMILIHYYCRNDIEYSYWNQKCAKSEATRECTKNLVDWGLIEYFPMSDWYKATEKGKVWLEYIQKVPLPVMKWEIPNAK